MTWTGITAVRCPLVLFKTDPCGPSPVEKSLLFPMEQKSRFALEAKIFISLFMYRFEYCYTFLLSYLLDVFVYIQIYKERLSKIEASQITIPKNCRST